MTFCGAGQDEIPKPKRNLQRTPPKANKISPVKDDLPIFGGGGMVSRDDDYPQNSKQNNAPVQKSPPRKVENNYLERNKKKNYNPNYDYLDDIKIDNKAIERKEKIRRSPVDQNRNTDYIEQLPQNNRALDKNLTIPLNINPLKAGNEFIQATEYYEENMYDALSPQKHYVGSPQTQKAHLQPTELLCFEDRVDDLL